MNRAAHCDRRDGSTGPVNGWPDPGPQAIVGTDPNEGLFVRFARKGSSLHKISKIC